MLTSDVKRCGARHRREPWLRCKAWPIKGRTRCKHHGGRWKPQFHRRNFGPMRKAVVLKQMVLRSWGIRWKDSYRKPTPKETIALMDDAIEKADQALVTITTPDPTKPDELKSPGELLSEGLWEGLVLGRDICRQVRSHVTKTLEAGLLIDGHDLKVMGLGSTTAGWLTRAGIRIAEGEFRAKRDDVLAGLLAQIALVKGEPENK
jgi:hypothetical protein